MIEKEKGLQKWDDNVLAKMWMMVFYSECWDTKEFWKGSQRMVLDFWIIYANMVVTKWDINKNGIRLYGFGSPVVSSYSLLLSYILKYN